MTTTIVYATTNDGHLASSNASYATARTGSGVTATVGSATGSFGQAFSGGTYTVRQTFMGFAFSAVPATEIVTSAAIQVRLAAVASPGVSRDLHLAGCPWSGSGLTAADWQTPTLMATHDYYATFSSINSAPVGAYSRAGNERLRAYLATGATGAEFVAVASRQVSGTVPTGDETADIYLAGSTGTASDPALIFTTVAKSRLHGVMGAQWQLTDETWAYLENTGAGVDLKHITAAGSITTIGALPIGTTMGTYAAPVGAQALAIVTDPADNIIVVGRSGAASGSLALRMYVKGAGYSWTPGTVRTAGLPAHPADITQVAAIYTATTTPTVTVLAARGAGPAGPLLAADTAWATFNAATLALMGTGDAAGIAPETVRSGDFGSHRNETGTGLDLAVSVDNPGWMYGASFRREQRPGDNLGLSLGRLVTTADGSTVVTSSHVGDTAYGVKDAAAKVRVVDAIGAVSALVTADRDAGYGITVQMVHSFAPPSAPSILGTVWLAEESIPSMPDGPVVGASLAWDVAYSEVENRLWIYYVDAANPRVVRRTPVSLDSYTATRQEVTVYTAPVGATIQAIRLPRGARILNRSLVSVAYVVAGVQSLATVIDPYNLPPSAPTRTPDLGFDATQARTLSWTFSDPNPGDTQTAYQLQIENAAAPGVAVVDTGKVASTTTSRNIAGGTLTNGLTYQWRVRTWDTLDTVGAYSTWGSFTTASGGTVTITDPAVDNPPNAVSSSVQVAWSLAGATQNGYRVWLYQGASLVSDSGWITSAGTTHLVSGLTSNVQHEIRVQTRNAALTVSNTAARLITPDYSTPEVPVLTVTARPEGGHVEVQVYNPPPAGSRPNVVINDVFRRVSGGAWELRGTCPPGGTFRDYDATSGVAYDYKVRGQTA